MQKINFQSIIESVSLASITDALDIAGQLENRIRARLAIYCYVRTHLRDKGLAIASTCRLKDLSAESSPHVADNIFAVATRLTEPAPTQQQQLHLMSLVYA